MCGWSEYREALNCEMNQNILTLLTRLTVLAFVNRKYRLQSLVSVWI